MNNDELKTRSINLGSYLKSRGAELVRVEQISRATLMWVFKSDDAGEDAFDEWDANSGPAAIVGAFWAARLDLIADARDRASYHLETDDNHDRFAKR